MPKTTLLSALEQLVKGRRTLSAEEQKVAERERRIIAEIERVLPTIGYRLVPNDARPGKRRRGRARTQPLPKTHKCPKCDRRFSLPMHVARHLSATHSRKGKAKSNKAAAS